MTQDAENKAATVIAELIDAFAIKVMTLTEDCNNSSVEALGRTKMQDGRYVAWQINIGLEEDSEQEGEREDDDDIAMVSQVAHPRSKQLN